MGDSSEYQKLIHYLNQVIDVRPKISAIDPNGFPFYLRSRYSFARTEFLGFPCILFSPQSNTKSWTPKSVKEDSSHIFKIRGPQGVFVCEQMSAIQRKRLIELHVPFIVPGYQLYLPDMGIDLRERFNAKRSQSDYLSPSAQHMLLTALQTPFAIVYDGSHMAHTLKTTRMTVSRAFTELSDLGLADYRMVGQTKQFLFSEDRRVLWEKALPYLRSPVQREFGLYNCPAELIKPSEIGGISALSHFSNISPPKRKTWVVTKEWYHENQVALEICEAPSLDWGDESVEIWKYKPLVFQFHDQNLKTEDRALVDPLSLYLSLKDSDDERVQQALESLIEKISW